MGIKKTRQQHGFTIIELSLFFAVSGLLLVTMLTGIGLAVQRQRFTDSVNGTQSFLQQQYNESQITINNRAANQCGGSEARGASDCLVIGKIIDLGNGTGDESVIKSYPVIVNEKQVSAQPNATPFIDVFLDYSVQAKALQNSTDEQSYIVPWGAKLGTIMDSRGKLTTTGASPVRYIMIVRSPLSGVISTFKLTLQPTDELFLTGVDTHDLTGLVDNFVDSDANGDGINDSNQAIKACLSSADITNANALLRIAPGSSQDAVTTQFDTPEKSQWCP